MATQPKDQAVADHTDVVEQMLASHKRILKLCIDALGEDKDQETRDVMIGLLQQLVR